MKIAILGTRGIPANFGGFETCAEKLSLYFVSQGHAVTVYNPDGHFFKERAWKGVCIRRILSKEKYIGALFSSFIFDYLSLRDAAKRQFDIILELGYYPAALFYDLNKRSQTKIVTNMAGMEWKRSKWPPLVQRAIKYAETIAIKKSHALISDNLGIKDYILSEYQHDSFCIPYGAQLQGDPEVECLSAFGVHPRSYYMLIARFQSDNNIEMILDGYLLSRAKEPFLVIGEPQNKYGKYIVKKYGAHSGIRFLGGIYDKNAQISALRFFSKLYFHGHSAGGTNPSLLEAMASNAYIVAHDNPFNRYVLDNNALYFGSSEDIAKEIRGYSDDRRIPFSENNQKKIKSAYQWDKVGKAYLLAFERVLSEKSTWRVLRG